MLKNEARALVTCKIYTKKNKMMISILLKFVEKSQDEISHPEIYRQLYQPPCKRYYQK